MPVVFRLAGRALCPPRPFWHVDFFPIASSGAGSNLDAHGLPDFVVPMLGANEGMSDLVQDRVQDFFGGAALDEVDR